MLDVELHAVHTVEKALMRLKWLLNDVHLSISFTSLLIYCKYKILIKNHSGPTKPWSFQIQYLFTDLDPLVVWPNSLPMLNSWYEINVQAHFCLRDLISLDGVNRQRQWINVTERQRALDSDDWSQQRRLASNDWQHSVQLQGRSEDQSISFWLI